MPKHHFLSEKLVAFRAPEILGFTEVSSQNQPEYLMSEAPFF